MKKTLSTILFLATFSLGCTTKTEAIPFRDGNNGENVADGGAGSDGKDGVQGPQGPKGDPGQGEAVKRTFKCDFKRTQYWTANVPQLGGIQTFPTNIDFWYYAQEMTSGATFSRAGIDAYCIIGGTASRSDQYVSNNSSEFWAGGTWEASTGANWLLLDASEACNSSYNHDIGNWEFLLDKQNYTLTVSYSDDDMSPSKTVFTTSCQ
jgi:hypothetical protein